MLRKRGVLLLGTTGPEGPGRAEGEGGAGVSGDDPLVDIQDRVVPGRGTLPLVLGVVG